MHEPGSDAVIGPSTAPVTASAFPAPNASRTRWRARRIVPMPCVMQWVGTCSGVSKNRALSARVRAVSVLMRVDDANDEPGSLKPT
jgi:hypothetical protein